MDDISRLGSLSKQNTARCASCHNHAGINAQLRQQLPEFVVDRDGNRYWTAWIDGHHRLAALYLSGAEFCPSLFAWSNLHALDLRIRAGTAQAAPSGAGYWGLPAVAQIVEATVSLCLASRAADVAAPA